MKRFITFLLIFIFVFCFSSVSFCAIYENKVFPDFPEGLNDVVVIIYESDLNGYRLFSCDSVVYGYGTSEEIVFSSGVHGTTSRYIWQPEVSDSWVLVRSDTHYTARYSYRQGENGWYDKNGNERILLYSNTDIPFHPYYNIDDFFFPENSVSDFYDFAIATHSALLEDYDKPSWWDVVWGGIEDFWDSIGNFLGSALSPLFEIMEVIGNVFEGFVNALLDIYEAVDDFFTGFIDTIVDILRSVFVPENGYLEAKLDETRTLFNNKFGSVIEMKDNILNSISQIQNKEFDGIKIDLSNFFISGLGEYYVLSPGPVNYYSYRIKPWISGLMLFLTGTYFLRKIISVIRGSHPL